jgi:hypothetical protein
MHAQACGEEFPLTFTWCWWQGVVTVGDYDGVVAQVHIASGHLVADVDEHDGRRWASQMMHAQSSKQGLPIGAQ